MVESVDPDGWELTLTTDHTNIGASDTVYLLAWHPDGMPDVGALEY